MNNPNSSIIQFDSVRFKDYIVGLGYKIDHDWRNGDHWYNIYDDEGLFLQIDTGVAIEYWVQDILCDLAGKPQTSPIDYKYNCPEGECWDRYSEFCEKVAANFDIDAVVGKVAEKRRIGKIEELKKQLAALEEGEKG